MGCCSFLVYYINYQNQTFQRMVHERLNQVRILVRARGNPPPPPPPHLVQDLSLGLQHTIHHPSHPHPLISFSVEPILSKCFACGKKHEGHFYHCTTCFNLIIILIVFHFP
ncbi:hypothetical protein Hanom_Chr04g00310641 [Helianthus anomalus]